MSVRPFKILNQTEIAHITQLLLPIVDAWGQAWLGAKSVQTTVTILSTTTFPRAKQWNVTSAIGDSRHRMFFHVTQDDAWAWSSLICGGDAEPSPPDGRFSPVVADLVDSAAASLACSCFDELIQYSVAREFVAVEQPAWVKLFEPGSGAALVMVSCASASFTFGFSGALCREFTKSLRVHVPKMPPLVPVAKTLQTQSQQLKVWLGEAELEVKSLYELAVGDVIVTDKLLKDPVSIQVGTVQSACRGYLVADGDKLAVRVARK